MGNGYSLLICQSQTEAMRMCHVLMGQSILGKVCRPPRRQRTDSCGWAVRVAAEQRDQAVWQLRSVGMAPCRIEADAE